MTKVEMAKNIYLQMWINFDIWCGKCFAIWFAPSNGKKITFENGKRFSHLQMNIFCHFNFCHNRRNGSMVQRNVLPICHFDCKFNYFLSNITFLNLQHWMIYVQSFLDFCICNMYSYGSTGCRVFKGGWYTIGNIFA